MTKWQIFVEYVLKNKVIWLLCFSNIFLYVVRIGIDQWSTVYAFQELKLSKEVAIQGFTLFEVGALVGTLLWGWLSDLANGRRSAGGLRCAGVDYRHPGGLSARQITNTFISPRCLRGFPGVWPPACDRRCRGRVRAEKGDWRCRRDQGHLRLSDRRQLRQAGPRDDCRRYAYFRPHRLAGTFAALDAAAIGCICLMAIVAVFEERKIRRQKKTQTLQTA